MDFGNGMSPADFAAVMGNRGGFGGGYGGFGGGFGGGYGLDAMWVILFLFAMNGGWGNGGWGNRGVNGVYDIGADMQRGFNQQATQGAIAALQAQVGNGFADNAVAQCQGNANITAAITNGQYATAQAITGAKDTINGTLNANQLATYQGLNQLAMSLQQCCCQNAQNIESLRFTVAQENCADRQEINNGVRDIIANQTANTQALINSQNAGFQAVQDKLCQLELDGYKQKVSDQSAEIAALKGAISQTAQTAALIQNNNQQTDNLIRAINPPPTPSYNVPNPYTGCCGNQGYYGCGCAA